MHSNRVNHMPKDEWISIIHIMLLWYGSFFSKKNDTESWSLFVLLNHFSFDLNNINVCAKRMQFSSNRKNAIEMGTFVKAYLYKDKQNLIKKEISECIQFAQISHHDKTDTRTHIHMCM